MARRPPIPRRKIAAAALEQAEIILRRWLPLGSKQGREWSAPSPEGDEAEIRVNLDNGCWTDGGAAAEGGDLISLSAHLTGLPPKAVAVLLAHWLDVAIDG